jgi:rhamnosyltransferase
MSECRVCAVIVTFHPQATVLDNLGLVRPQVEGLVIVDNGSSATSLAPFHAAAGALNFALIENGANLGIATALNAGVRWAKAQGFEHVLLFDQDSTVQPGFVAAIRSTYKYHPQRDKIAIVMPLYKNRVSGRIGEPAYIASDGAPLEVMTSGSFVPLRIFSDCGEFREDFFIDEVDHEFGFRVRECGYIVVRSEQAILLHAPGSPRQHSFLGVIKFSASHHNATRRYYITRNGIVMMRKYWKIHPAWSRGAARALFLHAARIVLAETDKWKKLRNMLLGALDGFRGRLGRMTRTS